MAGRFRSQFAESNGLPLRMGWATTAGRLKLKHRGIGIMSLSRPLQAGFLMVAVLLLHETRGIDRRLEAGESNVVAAKSALPANEPLPDGGTAPLTAVRGSPPWGNIQRTTGLRMTR